VHNLGEAAQIALFRVFNAARLGELTLVLSGNEPPARLTLREDLRTRIGQRMIYEMKPLSDEEKSAALARHALLRGMRVDGSLVRYLLSHGRRDLPSLMAVLDSLDRATLEQQRPATLPLLKEVMQLESHEPGPV
jgi:DnaA family protein